MISIITPVWNQAYLTRRFLIDNLIYYPDAKIAEWIIVNDGSIDDTPSVLSDFDYPKVITNEENLGFSKSCNIGAKAARGEILLFLNNDIRIQGDYLGAIGTALENENMIIGAELYKHNTGWNRFGQEIIQYIPAWCLAIYTVSFWHLGGFDERYSPCDYEDIDLCYTATEQGMKLKRVDIPILHQSGQTAKQLGNRREITERNKREFAKKWKLSLS